MKKLFLTSGIIACMACPAFAEGTGFQPTGNPPAVPAGSVSGACVEDYLGATSGNVQLVARWTADGHSLTLDNSTGSGLSADGTLYTIYDAGAFLTSVARNEYASDPTTYAGNLMSSSANNITPIPTGALVTVTYNENAPQDPTNSNTRYSLGDNVATDTSENRTFTGYYDAVGNDGKATAQSVQYVLNTGYIKTEGTNNAKSLTDDNETWYAGWTCTNQTVAPALSNITGYDFAGWEDDSGAPISGTICQYNDVTYTAAWTPHRWTITYDCSNARATDNGQQMGGNEVSAQTNIAYDSTITLATNTCSWTGYQFQGWRCEKNLTTAADYSGDTANYTNGQSGVIFHVDNNVTCHAVWQENTITLHWDSDDATAVTTAGSSSCQYDGGLTVPVATKTGYTLQGWDVVTYTAPGDDSANTVTPARP